MSAGQLVARLRSLGVGITASGERLRITAPRGGLTEQIKQAITAQKAELLDLLAEEPADSSDQLVAISRARPLPLSSFQQRLWVLHRLEPESTAYNMVTAWPIPVALDAEQAERAIRTVLGDHEILRATFRDDGLAPGIHLLSPEAVPVAIRDLRDHTETDQANAIRADISIATLAPFELAAEAPVRWTVYQLSPDRVAVLAAAHHIAMDEWSFSLLRRGLEAACGSIAAGTALLPPPALQYADYAAWQRRTRNDATLAADLAWWEAKLAGIPQICSFPVDRSTTESQSGSTCLFAWDADLVADLRALLRREGATPYMALIAVCATVLRAYTGQGDIVLGSPMGMRERAEFESMIGPFVNLLVLRLDLSDDPTFSTLLTRAREAVLDAHDHRQAPFEGLVERLAPARSFDRSPLFQVAVVLHNASEESTSPIDSGGAIHDLTWFAREVDGRIEGSLEFRSDLFNRSTIERITTHLQSAVRAMVRDPDRRISQISLLTAAERTRLIEQFNATAQELDPAPFTVQFERQAVLRPDSPAICFEGQELTYGTLNRRANQLARYLGSLGLGRGSLVGVCLNRSLTMVTTLLAVQKAGATYVPLDPGFPVDRLRFMLADSGLAALVASDEIAGGLDVPARVQIISVERDVSACDTRDASDLGTEIHADDVAYVIYTSGSTGRPNGVAVSHGALSNFLGAMRCAPGLAASDVIAAVTTASFDIAALELYLPLTVGARVELVASDVATDGIALAQCLSTANVTVLQATPSTWRLLIEAGWQGRAGFRALCGGETLPADLANAILPKVDALWNLYGPTETTIWSTAERVADGEAAISIGRPIANTAVYVLDSEGQPAGIGIPGEIWIGGAGVAAGYHQRPELTSARFAADPFAPAPGARMYRTGDLGRFGDDGRLFHMGRIDRQVKLRGFRIELGEVEAALETHPAVARAVAVARNPGSDHPRLVAYVVYRPAESLTASEARAHLRQTLPEYMIPSVFVALDVLPMTPNGKVDVRSLPDPFRNAAGLPATFQAPAPGLEELIAGIWRDLLQTDRISADDNFFEVGGHSLLSLRVTAAIERQTGCRIQPRILFFQTLRQVAAAVQRKQSERITAR
nr:amino acid adenylation domain-containing protein [uncultured Rhodopila sp.]